MPFSQDLALSFNYRGTHYEIYPIEGETTNPSVKINGKTYAVWGHEEKLAVVREIFQSLSLESIPNLDDLKERLSSVPEISFPSIEKTGEVGVKTLNTANVNKTDSMPLTVEKAYEKLVQELEIYAEKHIGKGALLVQIIGVEGAKPQTFGQLSVSDATPVDQQTIGRTGSGAKLWAALLSAIITKKYAKYIKMDDKLEKFAPKEALRKFGQIDANGKDVPVPELAKEMTLEAIVGMTAGLEYEERAPKTPTAATLDQLMRGQEEIKEGAIHLLYDPRDKISVYSNNISLTAYPLEKAYKKVRAEELIAENKLHEKQTLRELSEKIEPLRLRLNTKIEKIEKHLEKLNYQRAHTKKGSAGRTKQGHLNVQIDEFEKRLAHLKADLKKLPPPIPKAVLDVALKDLLESDSAYITRAGQEIYVYDLLDQFLMQFNPDTLTTTNDHLISYRDIMKCELLEPMKMEQSGFHGTQGTEMDVTYVHPKTKKQLSKAPPHENVMIQAAGGGRTTLADAAKLAQGLADKRGLIDKEGNELLSPTDIDHLFSAHGHYEGWGLGGSELACEGKFIEKGGSFDQDTYTFWVDRSTGIGLIAMCNCGKRPVHLLEAFKRQVQAIHHSETESLVREKEETPIHLTLQDYQAHPLKNPVEYYEGTRGKIAFLFDPDKEDCGIMHWSGTPLQLVKQDNFASQERRFRIITPGRFENVEVRKVKGAHHQEQEYLAVGDTSFIKTSIQNIPSEVDIATAKKELIKLAGDYINPKRPDWGVFRFEVKGESDDLFLCACDLEDRSQVKSSVPLGIIKVEKNAISFNGHDRQPPDKIFRFVRKSEHSPWFLQVTDVASPEGVIEERPRFKS